MNAYDRDDGTVVLDLFAYEDGSIVRSLMLDRLRRGERIPGAELRRCIVDPVAGTVDVRPLAEPNAELGTIDYRRRNGRPYRFLYAVSSQGTGPGNRMALLGDQLLKIDVEDGAAHHAWHEAGCLPGEPVFVPRPDGDDEDDGVCLSVVLDGHRETSFLLVLDAATFTEVARAELPQHVPLGFHGAFFSG